MNDNELTTRSRELGFSLIEAVIAIFIMTVGLIGSAAALSFALHYGSVSRNVTAAKGLIVSSIEEIETLRNSRRLSFRQIANEGSVDNTGTSAVFAGFSNGFRDVSLNPGPDGVSNTADDLVDAGPDGIYGTSDDFSNPALVRSGYQRRIVITNLNSTLKKVEITIRYLGSGGTVGQLNGVAYLNDETRGGS